MHQNHQEDWPVQILSNGYTFYGNPYVQMNKQFKLQVQKKSKKAYWGKYRDRNTLSPQRSIIYTEKQKTKNLTSFRDN